MNTPLEEAAGEVWSSGWSLDHATKVYAEAEKAYADCLANEQMARALLARAAERVREEKEKAKRALALFDSMCDGHITEPAPIQSVRAITLDDIK